MERKSEKESSSNVIEFSEIVKKAYDKGLNEQELTLEKLMEDLKEDLKSLVIG
ncbi:hypothetical protein ACFVSW_08630 [Neobacillus sp. NPDC058068]|uniref:hypothetical protein n=1 Tax=Neobacillus sp. NPDC058068 TaxID=3346325 RepID=UPI0036DB642B